MNGFAPTCLYFEFWRTLVNALSFDVISENSRDLMRFVFLTWCNHISVFHFVDATDASRWREFVCKCVLVVSGAWSFKFMPVLPCFALFWVFFTFGLLFLTPKKPPCGLNCSKGPLRPMLWFSPEHPSSSLLHFPHFCFYYHALSGECWLLHVFDNWCCAKMGQSSTGYVCGWVVERDTFVFPVFHFCLWVAWQHPPIPF